MNANCDKDRLPSGAASETLTYARPSDVRVFELGPGGYILLLLTSNLPLLLFMGYVLCRVVVNHPDSHWGGEVRWGWALCLPGLLVSIHAFSVQRRAILAVVNLCFVLLAAAGIFLTDHFNILVEYNIWLRRGMPGFGEWSW